MTRKNKKKASKRRQQQRRKTQNKNIVNAIREEQISTENRKGKDTEFDHTNRISFQKRYVSLLEETVDKLKSDNGPKIIGFLEAIFAILNGERSKRLIRLELINSLLSNVDNFKKNKLYKLNIQLNSVFFPRELKELMVQNKSVVQRVHVVQFFFLFGFEFGTGEHFLNKNGRRVQIKITASGRREASSIIHEAKILSRLQHENIIKLLAFNKSEPWFGTEYMTLGNLSDALEEYHFTGKKLLTILKDISSGMIYLTNKKYVLRNLGCENILLNENARCKISNFQYCLNVGHSDGIYMFEDTELDTQFAAPEVRQLKYFSTKSDVWDMAILMWEVFSVEPGKQVFSHIPRLMWKDKFLRIFISTGSLLKPSLCPPPLWGYLMSRLLEQDPKVRTSFSDIKNELGKYDNWRFMPGHF